MRTNEESNNYPSVMGIKPIGLWSRRLLFLLLGITLLPSSAGLFIQGLHSFVVNDFSILELGRTAVGLLLIFGSLGLILIALRSKESWFLSQDPDIKGYK